MNEAIRGSITKWRGWEMSYTCLSRYKWGWAGAFHSLCMEIVQKVIAVGTGVYLYNLDETEQTEKKQKLIKTDLVLQEEL